MLQSDVGQEVLAEFSQELEPLSLIVLEGHFL